MVDATDHRSIADRRADATREAIVEAAWELSRREGLAGWSLRQLAKEVGLAAPTLYAYVDSKHAIYDAMFQQGYEAFDAETRDWDDPDGDARELVRQTAHHFFDFATADPTRYQLMFQRVIPDFEPSPDAYRASIASYERFRAGFAALGVTDEGHLDLWTALVTGLTDQQLSNDPGGDRWRRLIDDAVDLYCNHVGIPRGD